MQIIIPMSGFGERFRRAGYDIPKPLIPVDGKPIIAHVMDLFPGEQDFLFLCNREHLQQPAYRLRETLMRYCPTGRIVAVAPHKLGPVYAVAQAFDHLDPHRPAIVNYCDFTCYWDYPHFKAFVQNSRVDGAIPAYRGFHPHSLGSTYYAYLRQQQGRVLAIQEKKPFTDHPMTEFASSGTYYFASAALLRDYFQKCMDWGLTVGGEYYVSLAYQPMLADGRNIAVYPLQHFMQWGTPEDLEEYQRWSRAFAAILACRPRHAMSQGTVMVPMAGLGHRFQAQGYAVPKPLVPVNGQPMVVQATRDLPDGRERVFILRRDMPGGQDMAATLAAAFEGARMVWLDGPTDGQARTCLLGMAGVDLEQPLTIGACDHGVLYNQTAFANLMADDQTDFMVWAIRGHFGARRHPAMYGWLVVEEDGRIVRASVKQPLAQPARDPIIIGTFTFKKARYFIETAHRLIDREVRVNGEFYLDSCINEGVAMGLKGRIFEVDHYLCWGTPDELRMYEYWQSCFHKWPAHAYRVEKDPRIPEALKPALVARCDEPDHGEMEACLLHFH